MQSRYYNPDMGRFISADSYASTGQGVLGYNMYAYCLNNPVCLVDNTGEVAATAAATAAASCNPYVLIAALAVVAIVAVVDYLVDTVSPSSTIPKASYDKSRNGATGASANQSGATASPMPPNDPNRNKPKKPRDDGTHPKSPKKVTDAYIRQNNIDAHAFKEQAGHVPRSQLSRFDIYQDTANKGKLWVARKDGSDWRETGFLFINLVEGWIK